jgi:hypothetical protein
VAPPGGGGGGGQGKFNTPRISKGSSGGGFAINRFMPNKGFEALAELPSSIVAPPGGGGGGGGGKFNTPRISKGSSGGGFAINMFVSNKGGVTCANIWLGSTISTFGKSSISKNEWGNGSAGNMFRPDEGPSRAANAQPEFVRSGKSSDQPSKLSEKSILMTSSMLPYSKSELNIGKLESPMTEEEGYVLSRSFLGEGSCMVTSFVPELLTDSKIDVHSFKGPVMNSETEGTLSGIRSRLNWPRRGLMFNEAGWLLVRGLGEQLTGKGRRLRGDSKNSAYFLFFPSPNATFNGSVFDDQTNYNCSMNVTSRYSHRS